MANIYDGVIDRISEGIAVILIDSLKKEYHYNISEAPFPLREGLWLDITLDDEDQIEQIVANEAKTEAQSKKISDVMSRVRKRKASKFKK